jgi:hypothetical protein
MFYKFTLKALDFADDQSRIQLTRLSWNLPAFEEIAARHHFGLLKLNDDFKSPDTLAVSYQLALEVDGEPVTATASTGELRPESMNMSGHNVPLTDDYFPELDFSAPLNMKDPIAVPLVSLVRGRNAALILQRDWHHWDGTTGQDSFIKVKGIELLEVWRRGAA